MDTQIKHKTDPNFFCYVCGEFTILKQRKSINATVKLIYLRYFGFEINAGIDVPFAPNICCEKCYRNLLHWFNGTSDCMPFGTPMLWAPLLEHTAENCYFCVVDITGYNLKTKSIISYPNLEMAIRPRPHSDTITIPTRESNLTYAASSYAYLTQPEPYSLNDANYEPSEATNGCNHLPFNNESFSHFVKVLGLSKTKTEVAASILRDHNLLDKSVLITSTRHRSHALQCFYTMEDNFVFCNNVSGLMEALNITYEISEWRLFIDSSKASLKFALINKEKTLPTKFLLLIQWK